MTDTKRHAIRSLFRRPRPAARQQIPPQQAAPQPDASRYRPAGPSEADRCRAERSPAYQFKPNPHIQHLDGVWWHDAPVPPTDHQCWAQTIRSDEFGATFRRCACGAASYDGQYWMERNSERNSRSDW